MISIVLTVYFQKRETEVINYRDYKKLANAEFRQQVLKDRYFKNNSKWRYRLKWILFKHLSTSSWGQSTLEAKIYHILLQFFYKQNYFKNYYGSVSIEK